jgi:hypothetical protein
LINDLQSRFLEALRREARELITVDDPGPFSDALSYMIHLLFPIGDTRNTGSPIVISTRKGLSHA